MGDGNELRLSTVHSFVCSFERTRMGRRTAERERGRGHAENRNWIKLNFISNFSFSPFIRIYIIFLLFALLCIGLLYIHFDVNSQFTTLTQQQRQQKQSPPQPSPQPKPRNGKTHAYEILNANRTKNAHHQLNLCASLFTSFSIFFVFLRPCGVASKRIM